MKLRVISAFLLAASAVDAFAPAGRVAIRPSQTARSFGVDPSSFQDISQHVDSFREAFSSLTLSDAEAAVENAASSAPDIAADNADAAVSTASSSGWFGFLVGPIEGLLFLIHSAVSAIGGDANSWGISIVMLTILIKLLTFPLTKTQLESTNKMQALQPTIKDIQNKYQSNPEVMNQKIAEVYQTNEVNPLAGCLPSLAQIPVFIGLYRSVLNLAAANKLDQPFLWLPSLEGPTFGADPAHGSDWILKNWANGAPAMGWEGTLPYLILPVFLVISQFVSMQLMQPKSQDPEQQQANVVLKLLPIMIGWFSLNVPSALCIYWVVNNIVTTATTLLIRNSMPDPVTATGGGAAAATSTAPPTQPVFSAPPPREKPSGFASAVVEDEEVKPITTSTAIDAEVVSKEVASVAEESGIGMEASTATKSSPNKKKRGKKSKKKKN
eukprot:CAMPEP_0202480566 /NCGR_PEP_ID=MMETSP1361-20130828/503_1 /ASSEMBLY_ACC=CAM_ASM_000849 /TAXON_ID=210615 /ORGANISM="Staurosira complex sp., Strain CCMP2646" /LENGTH=439 /DNA_ID=CAMNT_0049108009 /DNA_START=59 /DNA_END=1378 /DNA_ORIENTATION=+